MGRRGRIKNLHWEFGEFESGDEGKPEVRRRGWMTEDQWLAFFGAPGEVRQVSQAERSLPCKLPVRHVAERACVRAIWGAEPREANVRAASIEPVSASLHKVRVASLPKVVKPDTDWVATGTRTSRALRGERGRRVRIDLTGTWETRPDGPRSNGERESITVRAVRVGSRRGA